MDSAAQELEKKTLRHVLRVTDKHWEKKDIPCYAVIKKITLIYMNLSLNSMNC